MYRKLVLGKVENILLGEGGALPLKKKFYKGRGGGAHDSGIVITNRSFIFSYLTVGFGHSDCMIRVIHNL